MSAPFLVDTSQSPQARARPNRSVDPTEIGRWGSVHLLLFRFACVYFALYAFPFVLGLLPFVSWVGLQYEAAWRTLVPWFAKHVLRLEREITIFTNGSGDTTYDYVKLLCTALFALVASLLWSVLDRRRSNHSLLHDLLRVYVRYALGIIMVGYGMSKVVKLQFPSPSIDRLMQPYGESSPMGLLWTFMGYSTAYNFFVGASEALGGALLFWRRTTTLGALLSVAVMANIVVLNFSYDVPVKLFSANLLLMAMFLTVPDLGRLARVFVLNRPAMPVVLRPFRGPRWLAWTGRLAKLALLGFFVFSTVAGTIESYGKYGPGARATPFEGLYEVEELTRAGETVPLLVTDATCWRRVGITTYGRLTIRMMDDSRQRYFVTADESARTLTLRFDGTEAGRTLSYDAPDEGHLVLAGDWEGAPVSVRLRKIPESSFLLVDRGFHWINESPFNR